MSFTLIGSIPTQHPAETSQFERVIRIIKENYITVGSWAVVVLDIGFEHEKDTIIDVDTDWNGQIDILLLMRDKIVVYELKGFTAKIIKGKTDNNPWVVNTLKHGIKITKSYFYQASKCRAYILRDFLEKYRKCEGKFSDTHWVVDARIVLKDDSDFSGFFFRVPRTINEEDLAVIASNLSNDLDIELIRRYYSGRELGTNKLHSICLPPEEYRKVYEILKKANYSIRTNRWFKLLTEKDIKGDLKLVGSSKNELAEEDAIKIGKALKEDS